MNAYIVFKEQKSANKALLLNGTELKGKIIRVDLEGNRTKHNIRRSVFIGNLPFEVLEDELRSFFSKCGKITNIRIIRDSKLNFGKGFGFATFAAEAGAKEALKLNDAEFKNRKIRITKAKKEGKLKKKKKQGEGEDSVKDGSQQPRKKPMRSSKGKKK